MTMGTSVQATGYVFSFWGRVFGGDRGQFRGQQWVFPENYSKTREGAVVYNGATVAPDVQIGQNSIIGCSRVEEGVKIGRKVTIGDDVIIARGAEIGDGVTVASKAFIGHDSVIYSGSSIGLQSFIGARNKIGYHRDSEKPLGTEIGERVVTGYGVEVKHNTKIQDWVQIARLSQIGRTFPQSEFTGRMKIGVGTHIGESVLLGMGTGYNCRIANGVHVEGDGRKGFKRGIDVGDHERLLIAPLLDRQVLVRGINGADFSHIPVRENVGSFRHLASANAWER